MKSAGVFINDGEGGTRNADLGRNAESTGYSSRKKGLARSKFTPQRKNVSGLKQLAYFAPQEQRAFFLRGIEMKLFHATSDPLYPNITFAHRLPAYSDDCDRRIFDQESPPAWLKKIAH
jgi:hypothetical protein